MSSRPPARAVVRRLPLMIVSGAAGVLIAFVALGAATPVYTAHAEVLLTPAPTEKSSTGIARQTLESYAHVLGGRTAARAVKERLGLTDTVASVDRSLTAEVVGRSGVLRIGTRDADPETATRLADESAGWFVEWLDERSGKDAQVTATVVADAVVPGSASQPARPGWVAAGGLLGLLAGLAFVLLRLRADHSLRTPADLETLAGAPVLGAIAYDKATSQTPLITSLGTHHPRFEAVRILRTNVQFVDIDHDRTVITVTSSVPGEGKSTTACNLAIALAQTGVRVALVEGDLRRPRVAEYLGLERTVGLTTVLLGRVPLEAGLQQAATAGLDVLTSGALPPNPSEILQTTAMSALVAELRQTYDVVLIDAPPLLPVTDASLLASISDGAILVVRHGSTGREAVAGAVARLEAVGARLLGTVLTMAPVKQMTREGYGYGYGYGPDYFSRATGSPRSRGGARRERRAR